uniref:Uncharacterized protein n=1 Tax=Glossina austeni TaxID=7395 RepID=A0A1A9VQE8_GLOAU
MQSVLHLSVFCEQVRTTAEASQLRNQFILRNQFVLVFITEVVVISLNYTIRTITIPHNLLGLLSVSFPRFSPDYPNHSEYRDLSNARTSDKEVSERCVAFMKTRNVNIHQSWNIKEDINKGQDKHRPQQIRICV